jgi:hypothetical protein
LTFGLSDQALTKTGLVAPEDLKGREEANPATATVSEIAGATAPMLVPGVGEAEGAGLAARIASKAPSALVSKVGQAAEHVAARFAPEAGASIASRIAAKAIPKAIGSGVEGMAYGLGHEVSENALGDPNQTAQSVLAHVGLAGLLGMGLGAGVGAGEVVVPEAVGKARDALANLYGKGEDALGRLYKTGIGEKLTGTSADTAELLMGNKEKVAGLLEKFPAMEKPLSQASPEDAAYILDNFDKALVGNQRREAATGMREQLQSVLDEVSKAHKKIYTGMSEREEEALLQHVSPHVADEQVGKAIDKLSAAIDKMRSEPELYNQAQARALEQIHEGVVRDAVAGLTPADSFRRLNTLRGQISEHTKFNSSLLGTTEQNSNSVLLDLRSAVRGILHDESAWGSRPSVRQVSTTRRQAG